MTTGPGIAERRRQLDMTQDHLAGAACVSRSTVQRAERGLPVSAESLRSIRAVLGMDFPTTAAEATAPLGPAVDTVGRPSRGRDPWAWYADAVLAAPILALAVLVIWQTDGIDDALRAALPDFDGGRVIFAVFLGEIALSLAAACLAGRMLWRRAFHPCADRLVVGLGPATAWVRPWAGGIVELRRYPVPVLRWSQGSRAVRTWAGAAAMVLLLLPATLGLHVFPVFFGPWWTGLGYGDVLDTVPAWSMNPDSPLAKAGMKIGDRITRIDGKPVREHLDLVLPIQDAYGRTLSVEIARWHHVPGQETWTETLTLEVPVVDRTDYACTGRAQCAWIGYTPGLLGIGRRDRSFREILDKFGREIATVAGIAAHPDRWQIAWYRNQPGAMVPLFQWIAFRFAVLIAAVFLALGALAIGLGIRMWPPARRLAARIRWNLRLALAWIRRSISSLRSAYLKPFPIVSPLGYVPMRGMLMGSITTWQR